MSNSYFTALGEIAEFINGYAFKPSDWQNKGKRIIRIQNLTDSSKAYNHTTAYIDSKYLVYPGDILVSWSASLGVFEWVQSDIAVLNQHIFKVVPNYKKCWKSYLKYAIEQAINLMYRYTHGSTMKHINRKEFLDTKVYLPPIEEQKRIAAILDKADEIRRKRKQAIALSENLLRSAFLDMFGDPVTNPMGWEVKRLEDITTKITDGVHLRPEYTNYGVPFISVKDITTGKLIFDDCKFISREDHDKYTKRCKPEKGDILYTKVGATYGRPALVDINYEFSIYVSVCLIKPDKNLVRSQFLKEVMATSAVKRQADKSIKGIGVPDLHLNMIKEFMIPVPSLKTQDEFLKKTKKIKKFQFESEQYFIQMDNLFNSLLQRAFKGEL